MWQEYNPNPLNNHADDCTVRALCKALDMTWDQAYARLVRKGFEMCVMPSNRAVFNAILRENGFTRYALPDTCPDCYTLADFANDNPTGLYVACTSDHVITIIDGTIYDAWNSEGEIPLYVWRKDDNNA
jgi:hypothetical protein